MSAQVVDTSEALHQLQSGRRVADAMHDLWSKQADGTWLYANRGQGEKVVMSAEHLTRVWGPLTIIPEGGI